MRRALLTSMLLVMLGLSGCDPAQQGGGQPAKQGKLFGVSFQTMNNPFFVELAAGIREVVEAKGDRLVVLDGQFNGLKQKNDLSDLILQQPAGIFINPVNWEGITVSLLEARDKKVPCVVVDAPVSDADLVVCTVASDNVDAGRMAARALVKARPNAQVIILHLFKNKACIDRVTGFTEELAKHPECKILDTQEGHGSIAGARPVMLDLLGRFPQANAVFPINDPSALGAISALESAGKLADVTVVTVDGSAVGVEAIQAGKLLASAAQFPKKIGRAAAGKMYEHLAGKNVEKEITVPVELISKENVAKFAGKQF